MSIVEAVSNGKATPKIFRERCGSLALSFQDRWDERTSWMEVDLNITLGSPGSTGTGRHPTMRNLWMGEVG